MVLNQYIAELKKVKMLTQEEEAALWANYKEQSDLDARRKLIEHYQPLVFKTVMRMRPNDCVIMDAIQEGTVGLIEAVETYDHSRGVAFSLYSAHRIRGRILNYMEREGKFNWSYIDAPAGDDGDSTFGDILQDTTIEVAAQAEQNYLMEQVKAALGRLPLKEQLVLNGMYVEEIEPKQLAQTLNVSATHIYRLQKQGIRRIRGILSRLMQYW